MRITIKKPTPLPVGKYLCRLLEIIKDTGQYGAQLKWIFVVEKGHLAGRQIFGWCRITESPKGKFVERASACLDRPIYVGEDVVTDDLLDRLVVIELTIESSKDGGEVNKINAIRPYRQLAMPPPPPPEEPPEDTGDLFADIEDPFADS